VGTNKSMLTEDEVISYLTNHPGFLMQQPDLLELIQLSSSPEGTISLGMRQAENLRDKNRKLHDQLHALIENARQNTMLQNRVHQLCLKLLDTKDLVNILPLLISGLRAEFGADAVALRLFYMGKIAPELPVVMDEVQQIHADDDSLKVFDGMLNKRKPVCGRLTNEQKTVLFADKADTVSSAVCLPMGYEPCAGLLAIGSSDVSRFHADLGTDYLVFLGEVLMRLLAPYCHLHNE